MMFTANRTVPAPSSIGVALVTVKRRAPVERTTYWMSSGSGRSPAMTRRPGSRSSGIGAPCSSSSS
jgi:hypothetical protein